MEILSKWHTGTSVGDGGDCLSQRQQGNHIKNLHLLVILPAVIQGVHSWEGLMSLQGPHGLFHPKMGAKAAV